ncbi:MAG: hypothetical protein J1F43_02630 [Muribaculaceae bacterium]|nr:hypothetical protein [Muribaculaceae bacterium]
MKIKKYQFITVLLALYAIFMTLYFGLDLLKSGQVLRFWLTLGCETVVIILAFFALRRRDRLRKERIEGY